jgi:hypothetical protein
MLHCNCHSSPPPFLRHQDPNSVWQETPPCCWFLVLGSLEHASLFQALPKQGQLGQEPSDGLLAEEQGALGRDADVDAAIHHLDIQGVAVEGGLTIGGVLGVEKSEEGGCGKK